MAVNAREAVMGQECGAVSAAVSRGLWTREEKGKGRTHVTFHCQ